eukprot:scaffold22411_cov30-Tisochrysis_lutea.AAC.1
MQDASGTRGLTSKAATPGLFFLLIPTHLTSRISDLGYNFYPSPSSSPPPSQEEGPVAFALLLQHSTRLFASRIVACRFSGDHPCYSRVQE